MGQMGEILGFGFQARIELERGATTLVELLRERMDGVDRAARRPSLKERLGLKSLVCCGATWGLGPTTMSVRDDGDGDGGPQDIDAYTKFRAPVPFPIHFQATSPSAAANEPLPPPPFIFLLRTAQRSGDGEAAAANGEGGLRSAVQAPSHFLLRASKTQLASAVRREGGQRLLFSSIQTSKKYFLRPNSLFRF
ncbi:hypothetical protein ACS0TY_036036 [Phlomoides rotata]